MAGEQHISEDRSAGRAPGTDLAPDGQVWVCGVCGRRAKSRWGFDVGEKSTALDAGYDSSCMSHAVLCFEKKVDGAWTAVGEVKSIVLTIEVGPKKASNES